MLQLTPLSASALTRVVECLPSPVVLVDRHGFALAASPPATELLQLPAVLDDLHLEQHRMLRTPELTLGDASPIDTGDGEPLRLVAIESPAGPPPPKDVAALAGAVAHDFNNLLGVIMNFATLASATVAPGSAAASDLREVLAATQRAATIAHRLQELGDVRTTGRFAEPAE